MHSLTPEDLIQNVRKVVGFTVSPDGLNIAFSWQSSQDSHIYISSLHEFAPEQVTFGKGYRKSPRWSPDGKRIAFLMDEDGNERFNIHTVVVRDGAVKQITNFPRCFFRGFSWSPDGKELAFSANAEGLHSIFRTGIDGHDIYRLTSASRLDIIPYWSPDGDKLVYTRLEKQRKFSFVQVIDKNGVEIASEYSEKASLTATRWDTGGVGIISHLSEPGAKNLGLFNPSSGTTVWTAAEEGELDRAWSPDGRYAACVVNRNRNHLLGLHEISTGETRFIGPSNGLTSSPDFTPDGTSVLFIHEGPRNPSDLFLYNLDRDELHQLTYGIPNNVNIERLVIPDEILYPSFDGTQIPALLYKPICSEAAGIPSAVIRVHGGPNYQSFINWDSTIQLLLSHGFVVLAPNFRGSIGYGREFSELSRNDWGGGDLKDIIAAADYIKNEILADSSRIGIYGGSYGGYLTLMAMATAPEKWMCGVCLYGITDLEVFYYSVPEWIRNWIEKEIGTPEQNPDIYRERSPIKMCAAIKAPLLFLQGANDPRVPLALSMLLKKKMEDHGKSFRLKIYNDEGHGFQKSINQIDADRELIAFIKLHARGSE